MFDAFLYFVVLIGSFFGGLYIFYSIFIMLFLPPGHKLNVIQRRKAWQMDHPGKKHPFKY